MNFKKDKPYFEAIHPFTDGNGRTGRIINVLYLVYKRLLDLPILYLSRYIIQYKAQYYRHLRNVTSKNEWGPWILYMLDAIAKRQRASVYLMELEKIGILTKKKVGKENLFLNDLQQDG